MKLEVATVVRYCSIHIESLQSRGRRVEFRCLVFMVSSVAFAVMCSGFGALRFRLTG